MFKARNFNADDIRVRIDSSPGPRALGSRYPESTGKLGCVIATRSSVPKLVPSWP